MTIHGATTTLSQERGLGRSIIRDVVCGKAILRPTEYMVPREGAAYYFCSESCRQKFERNPTHYARPLGERGREETRKVA